MGDLPPFKIEIVVGIMIDSHAFVTDNTERSLIPFTRFSLRVTADQTTGQYHNQDTDIDVLHLPYSCFSVSPVLSVCALQKAGEAEGTSQRLEARKALTLPLVALKGPQAKECAQHCFATWVGLCDHHQWLMLNKVLSRAAPPGPPGCSSVTTPALLFPLPLLTTGDHQP